MILVFTATFFLSGCNEGAKRSTASAGTGASKTGISSSLPVGGDGESVMTVNSVVRSNQDPTNMIELIGQDGEIGNYCPKSTDCACRFNWIESSGILRQVDQELAYVETNMARCLFTQVSSNVTTFNVRIYVNAAGGLSNQKTVNMNTANPSLDPSLSSNYVPIQRYMCRDSVVQSATSGNTNFYTGLVDPRLWAMGYVYNFFTSSVGQDYGATSASTQLKGWECPPIPNDATYDAAFDLRLYSVDPIDLTNPNLTGITPGFGDNTIYPSSDNQNNAAACVTGNEAACEQYKINRHDYYLASFLDATYKIPICMAHTVLSKTKIDAAPNNSAALECSYDTKQGTPTLGSAALVLGGGKDIVGFAAMPDANQNCPTTAQLNIPAGKKWAKLWPMRASLPMRTIQDSNPNDIGQLSCTTRKKECSSANTSNSGNTNTLTVCHIASSQNVITGAVGGMATTLGATTANPGIIKYGNCNSTGMAGDGVPQFAGALYPSTACNTPGSFNCCLDYNRLFSTPGERDARLPANYTPGGDTCTPSLMGANNGAGAGGVDVWLLGKGNRGACIEADTSATGALSNTAFPDNLGTYALSPKVLDSAGMADTVYVVTPPSVKIENMSDPNDPVGKQYTPKRILPGNFVVIYRFNSNSLTSNPNSTSGSASGSVSKYPVCVLQDSK